MHKVSILVGHRYNKHENFPSLTNIIMLAAYALKINQIPYIIYGSTESLEAQRVEVKGHR